MKVFWTNTDVRQPNKDFPDLSEDSEYSQRIQYLGDKHHDCTMRLTDVRQTDSHEYFFRFITDIPNGKWVGKPGVTLDITLITDLQVESSGERVTEGHSVTLTCKSRCSLTDRSTFIWFKNTQSLSERNNQLILQSVRREDAGNYSCAVQGHKLTSPHQYINVIYPPKQTHVVVNSSGEIMEGDSVTLTCSSESNPPVQIYTWFKESETSSVGYGQTYSLNSRHSGWFYCVAQNTVGSQRSAAVSVNVKGYLVILQMVIGVLILVAAVFIVLMIIWRIWWMKKRNNSESQTVHHSPSHNSHKTCDDVYENVMTADDRYEESNLSPPVCGNIPVSELYE
ncbi:B-cell receptor CD22-like isoform X2 [Paramisgurnus dabryanus]